jgi:hypothetical protein
MLGVLRTDSFFPPSRNGRGIAASVRDYGAHRIAVAREMATRGSRPRPSGGGARGLGSLARLGLRPEAFHRLAGHVRAPVLVGEWLALTEGWLEGLASRDRVQP